MITRVCRWMAIVIIVVGILMGAAGASAHVLDHYVQASRLELEVDRINLAIDLSPGVDVAPALFLAINTNHDGVISTSEARAYANQVLREVMLVADDHPLTLTLVDCTYPTYDEMRAGTGTIRLQATSQLRVGPGQHRVLYDNRHRPEVGVYLVNALVPASPRITIAPPQRDSLQRQIQLEYQLAPGDQPARDGARWRWSGWLAGLTLVAASTWLKLFG